MPRELEPIDIHNGVDNEIPEITGEDELVAYYGDVVVFRLGERAVDLKQFRDGIAMCPADSEATTNESRRLRFLAGKVAAAGALDPRHQHLTIKPED